MNDMKSMRRGVLTIALLGVLAGVAHAQSGPPPGGGPPGGPEGPGGPGGPPMGAPRGMLGPPPFGGPGRALEIPPPEMLERLGLSDAQQKNVEALLDAAKRKLIRDDAEARIAEMDLADLIETDHPDTTAMNSAIDRITTLQSALLRTRVQTVTALRAMLTPEQRKKLQRPKTDARWH